MSLNSASGRSRAPRLTDREIRSTLPRLFAAMQGSDAIILRHFRKARIYHKADGSEVTVADRGAERLLRRRLAALWPRDRILGEEYGGELARSGRCWLLDPIDGTASYVLGIPMFGTLISLLIDGEPVLGCIHLSALEETTYAASGFGCWLSRPGLRARRVHVGPARALSQAHVGLSSFRESDLLPKPGALRLSKLLRKAGRLRLVGDCVQYALVCRGVIDAAVDPLMKPWDIAALAVCIREAGGSVSDLRGQTRQIVEQRSFVAASSQSLRRAICREVTARAAPRSS